MTIKEAAEMLQVSTSFILANRLERGFPLRVVLDPWSKKGENEKHMYRMSRREVKDFIKNRIAGRTDKEYFDALTMKMKIGGRNKTCAWPFCPEKDRRLLDCKTCRENGNGQGDWLY